MKKDILTDLIENASLDRVQNVIKALRNTVIGDELKAEFLNQAKGELISVVQNLYQDNLKLAYCYRRDNKPVKSYANGENTITDFKYDLAEAFLDAAQERVGLNLSGEEKGYLLAKFGNSPTQEKENPYPSANL